MKRTIEWTESREIEVSECGEFCGKGCDGMAMGRFCDIATRPSLLTVKNGKHLRTKFCKQREVKG